MKNWSRFVSPLSAVALAGWIVVMLVVAKWAIPVFANVPSGPQCTERVCPPTATTVELLPILLTGAVAATLVVGVLWSLWKVVSRRPGSE